MAPMREQSLIAEIAVPVHTMIVKAPMRKTFKVLVHRTYNADAHKLLDDNASHNYIMRRCAKLRFTNSNSKQRQKQETT